MFMVFSRDLDGGGRLYLKSDFVNLDFMPAKGESLTCKDLDLECHWFDLPRQVRALDKAVKAAALLLELPAQLANLSYQNLLLLMTHMKTELWVSGTDSGDSENKNEKFLVEMFFLLTTSNCKAWWTIPTPIAIIFNEIKSRDHHDFASKFRQ